MEGKILVKLTKSDVCSLKSYIRGINELYAIQGIKTVQEQFAILVIKKLYDNKLAIIKEECLKIGFWFEPAELLALKVVASSMFTPEYFDAVKAKLDYATPPQLYDKFIVESKEETKAKRVRTKKAA